MFGGMMKLFFFFTFWGVISINLGLFYGQGTDLENIFWIAKHLAEYSYFTVYELWLLEIDIGQVF